MAANVLYVPLGVYQSCVAIYWKYFLCLMLSVTYYAKNYAGIIGWSLLHTLFLASDFPVLAAVVE